MIAAVHVDFSDVLNDEKTKRHDDIESYFLRMGEYTVTVLAITMPMSLDETSLPYRNVFLSRVHHDRLFPYSIDILGIPWFQSIFVLLVFSE